MNTIALVRVARLFIAFAMILCGHSRVYSQHPVEVSLHTQTAYADVDTASFSPDGRHVLTLGRDGTARLWDVQSGIQIHQFRLSSVVTGASFSSQGRYVLTTDIEGMACVWDTATGARLQQFQGKTAPAYAAIQSLSGKYLLTTADISPDESTVLTACRDGSVQTWEIRTGERKRMFTGGSKGACDARYSPNGLLAFTVNEIGHIVVWSPDSGVPVYEFDELPSLYGYDLALSPGNSHLLSCNRDGSAHLWQLSDGKPVDWFRPHPSLARTTFSPDGQLIACVGKDGLMQCWDVAAGELRWETQCAVRDPNQALFSPDGCQIIVVGSNGQVLVCSATTGQLGRSRLPIVLGSGPVRLSPDGRFLLAVAPGGLAGLWNTASGVPAVQFEGRSQEATAAQFSPDGHSVLVASRGMVTAIWDLSSGRCYAHLTGAPPGRLPAAFSRRGRSVVMMHQDGIARVWDLQSHKLMGEVREVPASGTTATFTPDDQSVLTLGRDGLAHLWDIHRGTRSGSYGTGVAAYFGIVSPLGQYVLTLHRDGTAAVSERRSGRLLSLFYEPDLAPITMATFSPDDRLVLTASRNGYARLWSIHSTTPIQPIQSFAHAAAVTMVTFSPDGKRVLTASRDLTAGLWNARSGVKQLSLVGQDSEIIGAAFSPEGTFVLTVGTDGTTCLWSGATGRKIRRFSGGSTGWVNGQFSPDSHFVLTASNDGAVRVWPTDSASANDPELCRLVSFDDQTWAVVAPDGRFDTNDNQFRQKLYWQFSDLPMQPFPVSELWREFYQPRLLTNLLLDRPLQDLPKIGELNHRRPEVRILSVTRDGPDTVSVVVQVRNSGGPSRFGGTEWSGAKDLRVYRDGRLVAFVDGDLFPTRRTPSGSASNLYTRTFYHIAVPTMPGVPRVRFTACAFNGANIRADVTDPTVFVLPSDWRRHPARAYVISIGVGTHQYLDVSWDLSFAPREARRFASSLQHRLVPMGFQFEAVVPVVLTSQRGAVNNTATRERLQDILAVLAGRRLPASRIRRIPNGKYLRKASPNDVVILFYSGHGTTDSQGKFSFFDYNTGRSSFQSQDRLNSITLGKWLRPVDAGEMVIIIDACNASDAVEGAGAEKPGPTNSLGLGQMAFEKGMIVLTAASSRQEAEENRLTGSYFYQALEHRPNHNSIGKPKNPGSISIREWLMYSERLAPLIQSGKTPYSPNVQRPQLFDYSINHPTYCPVRIR